MYNKKISVPDNTGKHIVGIINSHACKTHRADVGEPCYEIEPDSNGVETLRGVCNKRAVLAGANGKISESSYQLKRKKRA